MTSLFESAINDLYKLTKAEIPKSELLVLRISDPLNPHSNIFYNEIHQFPSVVDFKNPLVGFQASKFS